METNQIDLTRLNRKERRNLGQRMHRTIPGRNLPYVKSVYGTIENFNKMRAEEIAKETKSDQTSKVNG